MMKRQEAEYTTKVSNLFFELPVEDRNVVLGITEALHRKRFGKKAILALAPAAVLHDFLITGVFAYMHKLMIVTYI